MTTVESADSPGLMFEVPLRTGAGQNDREHWRAKAHRVKREKETVSLVLQAYQPVEGTRLEEVLSAMARRGPVRVTLTRIAPSKGLDGDNLSGALKAVRDAVAKAMRVDDRESARLAWKYEQERGPWAVRVAVSARKPEVPAWTAKAWRRVADGLRDAAACRGEPGDPSRASMEQLAEDAEAMARAIGGKG